MPYELRELDGFKCFRTIAVMEGKTRVGTLQHSVASSGFASGRDNGKRHAWLGDGTKAGEHLGVFASQALALDAIRAGKRVTKTKFQP